MATKGSDQDDDLSDEEYAALYCAPERAELDLRVRALLRGRGWVSRHSDSDELGEKWWFPGSFGGRRINIINALFAGGIEPLEIGVEAGPPAMVRVHGCGVHRGCSAHESAEYRLLLDGDELAVRLDELEQHARTIDAAGVAGCFVFGPCGKQGRERDW